MIIYDIALDSQASGCQQTVRGFYRGEAGEKQLRITLMEPNALYPFSQDNAVAVFGKKSDGTCFMHACDIEDGKALYTPTVQTLAVTGSVQCQLVVYDTAGKILFTPEFCIEVAEPVRNETAVESSDDFQYLDALILKANEQMQFLRDIPALTAGSNGTLLCDGTLVGALVYAADYRELPEAPNGQLAYVLCDWGEQTAGFYLRFLDAWTHLPVPEAHTHKNKALLDALSLSNFHNHGNKTLLDSLAESDIHTHENKELLDNIEDSIDYLSETAHTHVNKDVLDVLTYADVSHDNRQSLDKLTVTDGELFIDGKRLENVIVWKIQKDPVIPAQPDGTLLYTVYGEDGLMSSDPYLVEIQGVLYRKPAPWKPGQLWVCRGGIWYLLASEGRTVFNPSEVASGGDIIIGGGDDDVTDFAPAPDPDEDESNSAVPGEVVLMPLNEPLTFRFREDFNEIPMYLTGRKSVTRNDSDSDWRIEFEIIIEETNGKKWSMNLFNDGLYGYYSPSIVFYDNVTAPEDESTEIYFFNGSEWKSFINGVEGNECLEIPDAKIIQVAGKTSIEELDTDELFYYKMLCQFVNTSVENMGVAHIIDGMIELRTRGGLKWGRTYYQSMESDTEIMTIDTDSYSCGNDYIVLYFYCHGTMDVGLTDVDFFVGGVPDTQTEGWHKWIFNRLPNGQTCLQAFDLQTA